MEFDRMCQTECEEVRQTDDPEISADDSSLLSRTCTDSLDGGHASLDSLTPEVLLRGSEKDLALEAGLSAPAPKERDSDAALKLVEPGDGIDRALSHGPQQVQGEASDPEPKDRERRYIDGRTGSHNPKGEVVVPHPLKSAAKTGLPLPVEAIHKP